MKEDKLMAHDPLSDADPRFAREVVGLDAVVVDERVDARPFARLLVRELELARDVVAGGDVAQARRGSRRGGRGTT